MVLFLLAEHLMGILRLGEDYQRTLIQALLSNRNDGTFCDVEITVSGQVIYAHKAVLAACSPFFRTMFHSDFREGNQIMTTVDLTEALQDHEVVDRVITSFYTGTLPITPDNMCDTYGVCSYLVCDQVRSMCMEYIRGHLNVETALAAWCITDNQDDMKGQLHSDALAIVKNRFHDYIIFQDEALELISEPQLRALVKDGLLCHCSPKQKLTFLLRWLCFHGEEKTSVFVEVLAQIELPLVANPSETLSLMANTLSAEGFQEEAKSLAVGTVEKFISKVSTENTNGRKTSQVSVEETEMPSGWEPQDDWSLNLLSHHLPNIPVTGTTEDAIIVLSPRYDEEVMRSGAKLCSPNEKANVELKICAYLLSSRLWIDLGNADVPTDDCGIPIDVCKFEMTVCKDFLYLHNNGRDLYRLSLTAKEWEIINPTYAEEGKILGIFSADVGGTLFFIIIRDIESKEITYDSRGQARIRWDIRTVVSLWVVDSDDDSLTEVLECPDELIPDNGITFGPCFNHDGFIFLRMKTDALSIEQHGCLKFDPTASEVTFEPFVSGTDRCQSGAWGFMRNYRPPSMDATMTITKGDWVYLFSKEQNVFQRMKQDREEWHLEKESITFPENFYRNTTHAYNVTLRQSLPVYFDVTLGSSLFRFINTDRRNTCGKLLEVNITKPYVITEHTPPSCDAILGASYAAIQVKPVDTLTMARFEYVEVDERRCLDPDKESMYQKSQAELPR